MDVNWYHESMDYKPRRTNIAKVIKKPIPEPEVIPKGVEGNQEELGGGEMPPPVPDVQVPSGVPESD